MAKGRGPVRATATISEKEEEVLVGDKLADRLGLVLEEVGRGMWRFRWESPKKLRKSAKPRLWA